LSDLIFAPPVAFLAYLLLSLILSAFGRVLAGPSRPSTIQTAFYASGEEAPKAPAAPGYRQFFTFALFFAILHLGVLMLGSGGLTLMSGVYLVGLIFALIALILG
jgi:NADH:ubiquinone oxidoreductase subunit 3 (subunit A)